MWTSVNHCTLHAGFYPKEKSSLRFFKNRKINWSFFPCMLLRRSVFLCLNSFQHDNIVWFILWVFLRAFSMLTSPWIFIQYQLSFREALGLVPAAFCLCLFMCYFTSICHLQLLTRVLKEIRGRVIQITQQCVVCFIVDMDYYLLKWFDLFLLSADICWCFGSKCDWWHFESSV